MSRDFVTEPDEWQRFRLGEWTKEPPTRPGCYPVAWNTGNASVVAFFPERSTDPRDVWMERVDWWWSTAMPDLPDPPAAPSSPGATWSQSPEEVR
jgi:hypothetical protein